MIIALWESRVREVGERGCHQRRSVQGTGQRSTSIPETAFIRSGRLEGPVLDCKSVLAGMSGDGNELTERHTILVVDDEETVRTYIHRILSMRGYRVMEAHDGVEALEQARRLGNPVDLLLTD